MCSVGNEVDLGEAWCMKAYVVRRMLVLVAMIVALGERATCSVCCPAHSRRCIVELKAARQKALDQASVVDIVGGSLNRRWRTEANMLSFDRRPIVRITSSVGLSMNVDRDNLEPQHVYALWQWQRNPHCPLWIWGD